MEKISSIDQQTLCPVLDTSLPSISQRSCLYPLEPIGISTPFVESLTSYICGLAEAHYLSVGSIYEFLLVPSLNKPYLTTPSHLSPASTLNGSFRHRSKNINGIGTLALEWVEMLESLTLRNDLRFLTLTTLSNVLPHYGLLRKFQAWCPACYEEMRRKEQIIYQPLIWSIAAVKLCARHHKPLVDRCPYCHRQLLQVTRRLRIGYCPRCGYWLGGQIDNYSLEDSQLTEKEINWQKFVISNVKGLLAALPNLDSSPRKEITTESLSICVDRATGGNLTHFAALLGKPLITFRGWYLGKVKAPLPDLLRICYCLDISILDLLRGADAIKRKRLVVRKPTNIPDAVISLRRPRPFDYSRAEDDLTKVLDIIPPISLAEAARILGYNRRGLHKKLPELCSKITSRYRDHLKSHYEDTRSKREEEVIAAVREIHAQGFYVTPRLVAEFLNKPSYLGRRDVAIIVYRTRELLTQQKTSSQIGF